MAFSTKIQLSSKQASAVSFYLCLSAEKISRGKAISFSMVDINRGLRGEFQSAFVYSAKVFLDASICGNLPPLSTGQLYWPNL
jgi:hypothetical protein